MRLYVESESPFLKGTERKDDNDLKLYRKESVHIFAGGVR